MIIINLSPLHHQKEKRENEYIKDRKEEEITQFRRAKVLAEFPLKMEQIL